MKVLMLSIDRGLLGRGQLGDVLERHKKYGEFCERLDIIVLSPKGFEKHRISERASAYPTNSKSKLKYFFDGLKLGKKLSKENCYDLIVCQEPFVCGLVGYFLKKEFKNKLLIHFHGDFWNNPNWLKENWLNIVFLWLSKFVVPKADGIRVMSKGQKEKLIKAGIDEKKIRVISTPVDLSKYMEHKIYDIKHKTKKIVLHVGRDDEVKDYDTLVKAFKIIKREIPGTIFGQAGADRKIKEAMTANNFYNIELKGVVVVDALIDLYYQCDTFVLSSVSESFGKVLVEANACGKPVISTATTGAKEIIQDGVNGFLVPIKDYRALADKIIYLLENPDKAREMGECGRKMMRERFGDNTVKIIQFWQEIINKPSVAKKYE